MVVWVGPAAAQLPSNASLQGAYYFRYLGVNTDPSDAALAYQGTVTFDGKGSFTVTGQGTSGVTPGPASNNTYTVLSNGLLLMNNPFDTSGNTTLFGGVGTGAVMASSTDTFYCDLFVAFPVSTNASAATLTGKYYVADMEFLNGSFNLTRDSFFSLTGDGKGGLGNVTIGGTALNLGSNTPQTQTSSGATYTINANGSGTLNLPAPSGLAANNILVSGNKTLYISPDGNLFIAGGSSSYDMLIGVKVPTAALGNNFSGLYFRGYLQNYQAGTSADGIYGVEGAVNEVPGVIELAHERTNPDGFASYDFTYDDTFNPSADGSAMFSDSSYAVSANGNYVIAAGNGTNYQLVFHVKAPTLTGSGVFLNPQGIQNTANSIPFTASVAPGEFMSLFGSGLASSTATASALPFPTTLGGATVTVQWPDSTGKPVTAQAPIYFASPSEIICLVPYALPGDGNLVSFTVSVNGTPSSPAQVYSGSSAPGVFTASQTGVGNGAIRHTDFSVVTTSSPAKIGETVQLYLTGLGAVKPAVTDGTAAPSSPLSNVVDMPDVYIDGVLANVVFAGLSPGSVNLYQLNVTIPTGVTTNASVTIEVVTSGADNIEATIPIGQ